MHTNTPVLFAFVLKLHDAINQGKERIGAPHTDIVPGFERRTALSHQDMAGAHRLAGEALHAEAFADTIAAVGGAALAFFVCHAASPTRDPLASEMRGCSVLVRGRSVLVRGRSVLVRGRSVLVRGRPVLVRGRPVLWCKYR